MLSRRAAYTHALCVCGSHRVGWRSFQVAARWSLQVETAADRCAELSLSSITVPGWHSDVRSLTVLSTLCFGRSRAGAAETHASCECAVALVVSCHFQASLRRVGQGCAELQPHWVRRSARDARVSAVYIRASLGMGGRKVGMCEPPHPSVRPYSKSMYGTAQFLRDVFGFSRVGYLVFWLLSKIPFMVSKGVRTMGLTRPHPIYWFAVGEQG